MPRSRVKWVLRAISLVVGVGCAATSATSASPCSTCASAYTAFVLSLVVLGGFIFEIAQVCGGAPYYWMGAIAGVTYLVCVAVLRSRG